MSASDLVARLRDGVLYRRSAFGELSGPPNVEKANSIMSEAADSLSAHEATIEGLRADHDRMHENLATQQRHINEATIRAEAAEARIAELEKALEFYRDAFKPQVAKFGGIEYRPTEALLDDCGNVAQDALRALSPLKKEGDNG